MDYDCINYSSGNISLRISSTNWELHSLCMTSLIYLLAHYIRTYSRVLIENCYNPYLTQISTNLMNFEVTTLSILYLLANVDMTMFRLGYWSMIGLNRYRSSLGNSLTYLCIKNT